MRDKDKRECVSERGFVSIGTLTLAHSERELFYPVWIHTSNILPTPGQFKVSLFVLAGGGGGKLRVVPQVARSQEPTHPPIETWKCPCMYRATLQKFILTFKKKKENDREKGSS